LPRQLTFDLPVRTALGRDDFFVSPANALAVATLDNSAGWPQGKMLLVGPKGAGKTHLAHVWAASTGAAILPLSDLATSAPGSAANVVVEDVDSVGGDATLETALFHLHNLVLAEGGRLLMTAATPPKFWTIALPDLASRMQATAIASLDAPDDALLAAVLVKQFADRQLTIQPSLIPWLIARMDRSFAAARDLVAALDARALATRRPIGPALAAEVLDNGV
jgi:chromosomal replication initiation ATPase DnaA